MTGNEQNKRMSRPQFSSSSRNRTRCHTARPRGEREQQPAAVEGRDRQDREDAHRQQLDARKQKRNLAERQGVLEVV